MSMELEFPIEIELVGGRTLVVYGREDIINESDILFRKERERGTYDNGEPYQNIYLCNMRPWTYNGSHITEDEFFTLLEYKRLKEQKHEK